MKAKPLKETRRGDGNLAYVPCEPAEATHVKLNCPGPYPYRIIPVSIGPKRPSSWSWNGDVDKPTLSPSILTIGSKHQPRCHSFVTDGKIRFLKDCTHELAGQTVDLLDVEKE